MPALFKTRFQFAAFVLFFVSGATGLIYEVVWTRLLTLVLGNTQYSVATVLTTFMAGLALGSALGGRQIDRAGHPLRIYAALEAAIGIYCLLIPFLIDFTQPLFQSIYLHFQGQYAVASLLRFAVCSLILIVPTTLMGATLPVLGKYVSRSPEAIGRDVGTLYALNTLGAVFGAWASAYLLMRTWGVSTTIYIAAALNLAIAASVLLFLRQRKNISDQPDPPKETEEKVEVSPDLPLSRQTYFVLAAFGLSGMAALIYQVAWNRILSLVLGSSVYAFSLILTVFILGLALGTLVFARLVSRFTNLQGVFGFLQWGIGLSALLALPFFGSIPLVNRWVYLNWGQDFSTIQWSNFLIIASLIFLPTFFMGGQFPVVVKLVVERLDTLGKRVGLVYASNTVGTILGSFLAGFLLIPLFGLQETLWFAIFLNVLLGSALLAQHPRWDPNIKSLVLPAMVLLCLGLSKFVPSWDRAVITSGSYMPYRIGDLDQALQKKNRILFYEEGIHTTVTTELAVTGNIFLRVNGKTDASLAADMRTQLLSGYLPTLFHPNPRSALVVGQGSGITLGAVEQFPLESIDLVEISPSVIEGSRFFDPFNHHALDDPRVSVILEDGRNHITLTESTYDVIVSEPSNPWISGVGALFTIDFYKLLKARLNPGGIACVWVHTNMSPESFQSIVRAFISVFPEVTMWESIVGDDYLLIGSDQPYKVPYEKTMKLLDEPVRGKELRRLGIESVRDLMGLLMMDRKRLEEFSGQAPIHTDDNSLLEFQAPEYIYKDERDVIVRQLTPYFGGMPDMISFQETDDATQSEIRAQIASLERTETQVKEIKRRAQIDQYLDRALDAFQRGAFEAAAQLYSQIIALDPDHVLAYYNLGNVYRSVQELAKAEQAYRRTLEINPYYIYGSVALAQLHLAASRPGEAETVLRKVLDWQPRDSEVRTLLGVVFSLQNKGKEAEAEWIRVTQEDASYPPPNYYLGISLSRQEPEKARTYLKTFLRLSQGNAEYNRLAEKAGELLKKL